MWPGCGPEGQRKAGALAQSRRQAVGAADNEAGCGPVLGAPFAKPGGKRCAVDAGSMLIENDDDRTFGNDVGDGDRFFNAPALGVLRPAFANFDDLDLAQSKCAPDGFGALAITRGEFAFRPFLEAANRGDHDTHLIWHKWLIRREHQWPEQVPVLPTQSGCER